MNRTPRLVSDAKKRRETKSMYLRDNLNAEATVDQDGAPPPTQPETRKKKRRSLFGVKRV